jgi:arginyl-tRNA synthetase
MKQLIEQLLKTAINHLQQQDALPLDLNINPQIERTRDKAHGDFATNVAMILAKPAQRKPRELAEQIIAHIPAHESVTKVEIAGPGFINFFLNQNAKYQVIQDILTAGKTYGHAPLGAGKTIHLEFVSSNPTGPLHVGHGRSAAYGAAVADLLEAIGYKVHREYYVNDGGRQMDILATSVWLRYLQTCGETITFPSNGYQGDYVIAIATQVKIEAGERLSKPAADVFKDVPPDEPQGGDKELHIDALIARAKQLLSSADYELVFNTALTTILKDIREDLAEFGVHYQDWFSERSLLSNGTVEHTIAKLKANGYVYEKGGALWFRATDFGDDKDRVVLRENGQPTYFATDIAHYQYNLDRGFYQLINILGADHHGYVARVRAAIQALGYDPNILTTPIVQFATLYRGKERVQMSTRSGSFVTLRELREEVGTEAARFFYILRKCEQHMDFDLELAKSQSNENPLYYLQYAHARICSVFRQLKEKQWSWDTTLGFAHTSALQEQHELDLLAELSRYPDVLATAAQHYEPHMLAHYLREVANAFHAYYNAVPFLVEQTDLRNARLNLIAATRQVLANGLQLLGVSAPEVM